MKRVLFTLISLLLTQGAAAQASDRIGNGAYCRPAGVAFLSLLSRPSEMEQKLSAIYEKCRPGDVIVVSKDLLEKQAIIARLCDFNRQIIPVAGDTMCVLAPPRPVIPAQ